jgi:hypothetical protein
MIGTALNIGNELEWVARAWAILIGGSIFAEIALRAGEPKDWSRPRLSVRIVSRILR